MEAAIAALLTQRNIDEAAKEVGISPNTLLNWMKVPEFQVAYREARLAAYSQAVAKLQQGATAAATTLLKGMLDQGTPSPPSIRTDKQSLCRWIAPAPVQFPPSPDAFHGSLGRVVCDAYIVGISAK